MVSQPLNSFKWRWLGCDTYRSKVVFDANLGHNCGTVDCWLDGRIRKNIKALYGQPYCRFGALAFRLEFGPLKSHLSQHHKSFAVYKYCCDTWCDSSLQCPSLAAWCHT